MTTQFKPWWRELRPREELIASSGAINDIQMNLAGVAYGSGGDGLPYRSVEYFGAITHPSPSLCRVAADVAVRLGGRGGQAPSAKPVWRFDQGMGGGKSHALVALWHMATDPRGFAATDVGSQILHEARYQVGGGALDDGLGAPIVVALPGDQLDPQRPDPEIYGGARTLWELFLFRLYEGDHDRWRADKDTISYQDALRRVGRPVLILFDEVMHYVRRSSATGSSERAVQDQAFLIDILRHTNEVPNCVAVMVMIEADKDPIALSGFGQQCRDELEAEAVRGEVATEAVTSPNDFAQIIRRRLFSDTPDSGVVAATSETISRAMRDSAWDGSVFGKLSWAQADDFPALLEKAYPFHPSLMHLAEHEWPQVAGFQRVRSTIRVFSATVFAHLRRLADSAGLPVQAAQKQPSGLTGGVWAPTLIGPGDLVLSDPDVREALLGSGLIIDPKTAQNYRQVIATDIVDEDDVNGNARAIDLAALSDPARVGNPRAAERAATAALLYSISDRPQGRQGGSVPEIVAACHVPNLSFGHGDAEVVLESLKDPQQGLASLDQIPGKGGQPPRLFLSTKKTFGMFMRDAKNGVSDEEREDELLRRTRELIASGPFSDTMFVERPSKMASPIEAIRSASIDKRRKNRLVVLDPRAFTLLNGADTKTRHALRAAMGLGADKLAVNWASSAVFVCVNTQRRRNALIAAGENLAAMRVAARDAVRGDPDLEAKAAEKCAETRAALDNQIRAAFQHIVWLADTGDAQRGWAEHRFEADGETALDGSHVWRVLEAADKAFGVGEFSAQALLHNLVDNDYGKPLSELRDDFWRIPRLPLLPNGEKDLRWAIWDAIRTGQLEIVDSDGARREAHSEAEINLSSDVQRLAKTSSERLEGSATQGTAEEEPTDGLLQRPPQVNEKKVAISATRAVDADNRDALRVVLDALRNSVEDGAVSWLQMSLQTVMTPDAADQAAEAARSAGLHTSVTDL